MAEIEDKRMQALKDKIKSFNEIVKEMPKDKVNNINSCYFTTSELNKNSKNIMVKMNYKNELNANASVSLTINVNELFKLPANEVVKELYKIASKPGMNNESNAKTDDMFRAYMIISVRANQVLNARKAAGHEDMLSPIELTHNLMFILSGEKIAAIVEGKMSDVELDGLINNTIDAANFNHPSGHKAPSKEEQTKKQQEEDKEKGKETSEEEAEQEVERKNKEFAKSLEVEGGEQQRSEAGRLLDGNIHERSAVVNNTLTKDNALKESFNTLKNNMHSAAALKAFSEEFSKSFMAAHGLPPVPVRVVNNPHDKGTMGEYYDEGSSHHIEINQAGITDITEFTATLAHELTHAVDASLNKINGLDGIQNSMPFDVTDNSASGADKAKAEALLRDLNYKCYQADPCEQTARNGEQIGLDFVRAVGGKEFDAQIAKYQAGDEKTQRDVNNVREHFDEIISNAEEKLASLNVDGATKAKINERISYLKSRQREKQREDGKYYESRSKKPMANAKDKTVEQELQDELDAQAMGR